MYNTNQIFAAPLAGITDKPFRKMIRLFSKYSPILTEMISSHAIVMFRKNNNRNFDEYFNEGYIGVQIFGSDPYVMAESAKILEDRGASFININMGCPVPKVAQKASAGAFLMKNHKLAETIIKQVKKQIKIPLTVKTRLGWDSNSINWKDLAQICLDNGVETFFLHGRTRADGYTGHARFEIKPNMNIQIIANGDIKSSEDVEKIYKLKYDGVMIGRYLLGRPYGLEVIKDKNYKIPNLQNIILQHFDFVLSYYGEKIGLPLFRKHLMWYSSEKQNSQYFRKEVNVAESKEKVFSLIKMFFN